MNSSSNHFPNSRLSIRVVFYHCLSQEHRSSLRVSAMLGTVACHHICVTEHVAYRERSERENPFLSEKA